ncbi:MAG: hypothetical protein IT445_18855 [Phycisphaeraceae bacterium]|nr:hypothetical protein [Phycisphaeraceae bacterium]
MNIMRKWLWRIAWGMSLLNFIVLTLFWLRSAHRVDEFYIEREGGARLTLCSEGGAAVVEWIAPQGLKTGNGWGISTEKTSARSRWNIFHINDSHDMIFYIYHGCYGIFWGPGYDNPPGSFVLIVADIYLMALAATPIVIQLIRWLRRRRTRQNMCASCGYDLRASTGSCPECGDVIPVRDALQDQAD